MNDETLEQRQQVNAMRFTPGPWTVGKQRRIQAGNVVLIGEREITAPTGTDPIAEAQANAQLIASSPDLLQVCKLVLEMFMDSMFIWGVDDDEKVCRMQKALHEAIRKAEGHA